MWLHKMQLHMQARNHAHTFKKDAHFLHGLLVVEQLNNFSSSYI